jgi:hypothetical protein
VDFQWCCSMPFLTRDFHWAQSLFYMGLQSAMSFHSGHHPVFLQHGPYVWSFICSQSGRMPAGCGYSCYNVYLLDGCPCISFVAVGTLFLAW